MTFTILYLENHCLWIMYLKFYIVCHSIFTQLLVLDQLSVTRWFVTKGWFSLVSWVGVGVGVVIRSVRFNNLVKMAFWFCLRLCCSWSSELLKSQAEAEELNRFCFWLFLQLRFKIRALNTLLTIPTLTLSLVKTCLNIQFFGWNHNIKSLRPVSNIVLPPI